MVDQRILDSNKQAEADFAEKLAKVAASGGCPKCASKTILMPQDKTGVRQCLHCGNKFEFQETPKEKE